MMFSLLLIRPPPTSTLFPYTTLFRSKGTPAAEVLINGVRLGAEPTPLLHGDKVEVGGHELTFVDERRSGSTQFVQKVQMPEAMAPVRAPRQPGATAHTGGRVVSPTAGRASGR